MPHLPASSSLLHIKPPEQVTRLRHTQVLGTREVVGGFHSPALKTLNISVYPQYEEFYFQVFSARKDPELLASADR